MMDILFSALAWSVWCFLHSLLAGRSANDFMAGRLFCSRYRLFYNIFSIFSLGILLYLTRTDTTPVLFSFDGIKRPLQIGAISASFLLFISAARHFSLSRFSGLDSRKEGEFDGQKFTEEGVYAKVRHPMYLAGILIIWARTITVKSLVINTILTLYFIIGAILEERRLLKSFPGSYSDYRKRVPMLIPALCWLKKRSRR